MFNGSLSTARKNAKVWCTLKNRVAATIAEMPLWKLQIVGRTIVPFLYEQHGSGNVINLLPGVVFNFRTFYDLIRSLVQIAWIRHIRMLNQNIQSGDCFYCQGKLRDGGDLDHFIPWSRYPLDLGHNFVLSHSACNRSKRDFLAAPCHLEKWQKRNHIHGMTLGQEFDAHGILHNQKATEKIAIWAYSQAEAVSANLWLRKDDVFPIDRGWRSVFGAVGI
jgi:hypothetical protein